MAFDGIVTKAIVTELKDIIGYKIDKIHQPDQNTIILGLYSHGKHLALNICIDSHNYRLNLTTHNRTNPTVAPNFCMLLRKYLIGTTILNISMVGLERIVNIELENKILVIELMGKHSNIILIDKNNIIIDAMRHIDSFNNANRDLLPAHIYKLPISTKHDFTSLTTFDDFYSLVCNQEGDLAKNISNTFTGFSLSFITSAINKCNISSNSKEDLTKLYLYISNILNNINNLSFEKIYKNEIVVDYVLILKNSETNFSLNFFIDDFYFEKESSEIFITYRNSILKLILDVLKKYSKRLLSINAKLEECSNMDIYKLYGELITANLYRLSNTHSDSIEIENYYDNNNLISIPLDVKYSPSINAKHYFKKYTKLKNAFQVVTKQRIETEQELNYIESIVYELENCSCLEEVQDIFEEISENVIFKEKLHKKVPKKSKKSKKILFSPIEYNIDGYKIYVGRNNKENDWLTLHFADKNDMWFHAKDIHGSHVILKVDKPINTNILIKCAEIAARHSKAKFSSNVPIDYCLVQFVKKPHGAKPGMVIFTNNKTLNVNP